MIDSQKLSITSPYSEKRLKEVAILIRESILDTSAGFANRIQDLLSSAGVYFVVTENLPNVPINGVARWLNSDRPLIQLSIYGKSSDKFWFSLFHEIGHILLHGKKMTNIDMEEPLSVDVKEAEANEYAQNILIPKEEYVRFLNRKDFNQQSVLSFSKMVRVPPGVVVGRLQLEGLIGFGALNSLKSSLAFEKKNI